MVPAKSVKVVIKKLFISSSTKIVKILQHQFTLTFSGGGVLKKTLLIHNRLNEGGIGNMTLNENN